MSPKIARYLIFSNLISALLLLIYSIPVTAFCERTGGKLIGTLKELNDPHVSLVENLLRMMQWKINSAGWVALLLLAWLTVNAFVCFRSIRACREQSAPGQSQSLHC